MLIHSPDKTRFKKYGKIIEYPDKGSKGTTRNLWRIVHDVPEKTGWRVAYLVLRDKSFGRMECHPESDETFEPVKGEALIFLSDKPCMEAIECFRLNRPVILRKGIWHALVSVTPEAEIKIVENHHVTCRHWNFGFRVKRIEEIAARVKKQKGQKGDGARLPQP